MNDKENVINVQNNENNTEEFKATQVKSIIVKESTLNKTTATFGSNSTNIINLKSENKLKVFKDAENVRKIKKQTENEKPLFVTEEKEKSVKIQHKLKKEKEVVEEQIDEKDVLLLEKFKVKFDKLNQENQLKSATLSDLRKELAKKRKLKENIADLKDKYKEQVEFFDELKSILSELNDKGLEFQQKYDKNEQEINRLLNLLAETKYKLNEIKK